MRTCAGAAARAFPTGVKWGLVPMGADAGTEIPGLQCRRNGTRHLQGPLLMEQLPHQLIESMIVAAYGRSRHHAATSSCAASTCWPPSACKRRNCRGARGGYLGQNILGTGWSFDLFVHTGAGRYICGEETALINSLEGRRANPRAKPPFPQIAGAWGKPTDRQQRRDAQQCRPDRAAWAPTGSRACRRARVRMAAPSCTALLAA
jgi:NADH-quinone oxidoreductase subunit F